MISLHTNKETYADDRTRYRLAKHRLINILFMHFLERLLFLSVVIVVPLKWVGMGYLTAPETGLFFFCLFFMYRCTPLFFSYIFRYISRETIFIAGGMIECLALFLLLYHHDRLIVFSLALLAGVGGGATTTMLISMIESANLDVSALKNKIADHDIFNIHLMLINVSALLSPLLAFLSVAAYRTAIISLAIALLLLVFNMLRSGKFGSYIHIPDRSVTRGHFDNKFLLIWIATVSVWAAASIIYAILPSLDSIFLGQEGINFWLSFDALVVIVLFFILKLISFLRSNTIINAAIGLLATLAGLMLILVGQQSFYIILLSLVIMAFGGYVAFGQLYGLAMQTPYTHRKTFYLGLLSFSGALGEAGMQGLFWLTQRVNFCLAIACCLILIGLLALGYLGKRDRNFP